MKRIGFIDLRISNVDKERVIRRTVKKNILERYFDINSFGFEVYWYFHCEKTDMNKNVKFKKINNINHDIQF